ncbi:MAG: glycosyltransferase, partial [Xanthobacteraceae bacterium]|nr:glycosyltransferase [Xanthobacteraceae bacterium]
SVVAVLIFWARTGRVPRLARVPRVAVLVAVKGRNVQLDPFLRSLFDQDYPDYRVIFAVESQDDPAVAAIVPWRRSSEGRVTIVVGGLAIDEGQKTANLLAAVSCLTPADEVIVLADADILADRNWITQLVAPLANGEADLVSGFTWVVATDRRLATFLLASMASALSTFPRLPFLNVAWGGSTALTRQTFEELGVAAAWRGTLSDDLQLTAIAQRARCRIAAPPDLLPRTLGHTEGFAAVGTQARRWYMLVRVYLPASYVLMLLGATFAASGWIGALAGAVSGSLFPLKAFAAALVCAALRNVGRASVIARLWGRTGLRENLAFLLIEPLIAPVASVANAAFAWSALAMRRTTWAGITYELRGPQKVRVLARRSGEG